MTQMRTTAIALILLGFILIAIGSLTTGAEFGGVFFIGPIPIIFGTSPKITVFTVLMAAILMLIYFFTMRGLRR